MATSGYSFDSKWTTGFGLLLLWTFVGAFFATAGGDVRGVLLGWYLWGVFAWLIGIMNRRLPVNRDRLMPRLLWHIPLSVLICLLYLCLTIPINAALAGQASAARIFPQMAAMLRNGSLQWNLPTYWLILGAHLALDYRTELRARKSRESELELLLTEARLSALRAQLNPHFLFNALNTVSAYVESEPLLARNMLGHLGDLLRMSLDQADRQEVPLAEELAFLEHYLAIQRVRFGDRLQVNLDIDPNLLTFSVPSLLLQPLAENAITHGLAPGEQVGHLKIEARQIEAGSVQILVVDNGMGLPPSWNWERDAGIGLTTTRSRLVALYGDRQSLTLSNNGAGVTVEIVIMKEAACQPRAH